jgi:hypothetical protein
VRSGVKADFGKLRGTKGTLRLSEDRAFTQCLRPKIP